MAGEWNVLTLSEAGIQLIDCVHKTPADAGQGYPYIAIPQMKGGHIDFSANPRLISEADFLEWTKKARPQRYDIVVSRRCNPGEIAFVSEKIEFALGQNLVLLRADNTKVFPPFLRWLAQGTEWRDQVAKFLNVGAIFDSLRCADIPKFEITVPPVHQQQAIAHILGSLDDKIELNRRTNETLEAMARALFKSWFVDFDPVRAKAEGRAPAGMDAATAALFPDNLQGSSAGPIPIGWRVSRLGDFVELQRGTTYKSSLKGRPGPYLLGLASIQRNGGFRDDKLTTYGGESPDRLLLEPGDIFVSFKDVTQSADLLGAVARVPGHIESGRLTQDTVKLSFKTDIDMADVIYLTLLTSEYRDYCRSHATGTTNLGLSREDFLSYPVIVASKPVIQCFNDHIGQLQSRAELALTETKTLVALRDALLPRLLSGELPIPTAERIAAKGPL